MIVDDAIEYTRDGWAVFPCQPGRKVPYPGSAGVHDATVDEDRIRSWWASEPTANVAIATGQISRLLVVDVDADAHEIMLRLPPTLRARTPRGGWHYYYGTDEDLRSTASTVAPRVDTRGTGGYVLAPPSSVVVDDEDSAHHGQRRGYTWVDDGATVATVPEWLAAQLRRVIATRAPRADHPPRAAEHWADAAVRGEVERVQSAQVGQRNSDLNRAAFRLGQIVAGGGLREEVAIFALLDAAIAAGLPEREAEATIASGIRGGARDPRRPEARPIVDMILTDSRQAAPVAVRSPPLPRATLDTDKERTLLLGRVRSLGGLCESFSRWVIDGADHEQPAPTLGALLALGAAVAGRRLQYRGQHASTYAVVVGASATGKDRPQKCLHQLLSSLWPATLGPSTFSSSAALVSSIERCGATGTATTLVLDEYGMQLSQIMGRRPQQHRQEIKQHLVELSTIKGATWTPGVALTRGGGALRIHAPVVVVLGSSTPESLYSCLSGTEAADGFLGRHLWFSCQDVLPIWRDPPRSSEIPVELVEAVIERRTEYLAWHRAQPLDTGDETGQGKVHVPIVVEEDRDVHEVFANHKRASDHSRRLGIRGDVPDSILGRLAEHAVRVALSLSALCGSRVTTTIARLAVEICEQSASVFSSSLIAGARPRWDDPEAAQVQVLAVVRHGEAQGIVVTRSYLLRAIPSLPDRAIRDTIDRLVITGQLTSTGEAICLG